MVYSHIVLCSPVIEYYLWEGVSMDLDFVRRRITELRIKKDISEYKMSLDLGHNKSYIQHIVCGRSKPSLQEFLYICEYLGVTPCEFFDDTISNPGLAHQAYSMLKELDDEDILAIISVMKRINKK